MFSKAKLLLTRYRHFLLFCVSGVINTVFDFLVFTVLTELGVESAALCQAAGYCTGVVISFLLNRFLTFRKETTTSLPVQIMSFILVNAVSLLASIAFIKLLIYWGLDKYVAKVIVTIAVALINYLGYKIFVFGVDRKNK